MMLGEPQGQSAQGQKMSFPPGFDPPTVQPMISPYTDYANLPYNKHVQQEQFSHTSYQY